MRVHAETAAADAAAHAEEVGRPAYLDIVVGDELIYCYVSCGSGWWH
jgi:hypothetical protein